MNQEQRLLPSRSSQPRSHPERRPSNPFPLHSALVTLASYCSIKALTFSQSETSSMLFLHPEGFPPPCSLKQLCILQVSPEISASQGNPPRYTFTLTLSSASGPLVNSLSYQCYSPVAYFSIVIKSSFVLMYVIVIKSKLFNIHHSQGRANYKGLGPLGCVYCCVPQHLA